MAEVAVRPAAAGREAYARTKGSAAREMGFFAVFVFAISSIGITYSGLFPFSTFAGLWPGSNLVGALAVMLAVSLVMAYVHATIGSIAPHFGADYLLASRVISPPLAFATSLAMVIFFAMSGGSIIASLAQNTLPAFVQILARITYNKSLLNLIEWGTSPYGITVLGTVGVVTVFLLLLLPPGFTRRLLLVGFGLALLAWLLIDYQLASAPAGSFSTVWNTYVGEGSYLEHLITAEQLGMRADAGAGMTVVAGLLFAFWIFYGYASPTCLAGEVKDPGKNLFAGMAASLLVSFGVIALAAFLLLRQVPAEWLSAESYLYQSSRYDGLALPWIMVYGAFLRPSVPVVWVIGLAWIFTILSMAHAFLYAGSRVVLAWVDDLLMPRQVAFIHPVLRSPIIAILLVCVVAEFGVLDTALSGDFLLRFNPLFFMAATQLLPVLAVTLLPYKKPDWYAVAPPLTRVKIGPVPLVTLLGGATLIYLVWVVAANAGMRLFGGIGSTTLGVFALIFITGILWFYVRQSYLANEGVDLHPQLKELPEA